jgi:hypothetical protein
LAARSSSPVSERSALCCSHTCRCWCNSACLRPVWNRLRQLMSCLLETEIASGKRSAEKAESQLEREHRQTGAKGDWVAYSSPGVGVTCSPSKASLGNLVDGLSERIIHWSTGPRAMARLWWTNKKRICKIPSRTRATNGCWRSWRESCCAHLKTTDDLFASRPSPRTESLIASAVQQFSGRSG